MTTDYNVERRVMQNRYEAALDFIDSLPVKPQANEHLIAADYALNGSIMRSFDPGGADLRAVADAIMMQS